MNRQCWYIPILALCLLNSCRDDSGPRGHKSPPSARVDGGGSEANAALVILTKESVERLGIKLEAVSATKAPTMRLLGANVMLPTDARKIVRAPFMGRLLPDKTVSWPSVGQKVRHRQILMSLEPILSPERAVLTPTEKLDFETKRLEVLLRRSQADSDHAAATARLVAAESEYQRASALLENNLGDVKRREAALAEVNSAKAAQEAAERALALLKADTTTAPKGEVGLLQIRSPIDGLVENLTVSPGQLVPAGAELATLISTKELWLSIDLYAGEIGELNLDATIDVSELGRGNGEVSWRGTPLKFMMDNQIGQTTTRRYYRLEKNSSLQDPARIPYPGERVAVRIPRHDQGVVTTLPMAAVIYDLNGASWVYCEEEEGRYRRAPILIQSRENGIVRLVKGPKPGVRVVIEGAAELFGTEFGTGK